MVRSFNCMAHAEATEDEGLLLVEATSHGLDSVLWNEMCAGYYIKVFARKTRAALIEEKSRHAKARKDKHQLHGHNITSKGDVSSADDASLELTGPSKRHWEGAHRMNLGQVVAVRNFSQVNVRVANEHTPLAYLRTQDRGDTLLLFDSSINEATNRSSPHASPRLETSNPRRV
nr:unnamed protein product [Leishmania braziliensis]CAJ2481903.1 unnamed protein product [Leishmania braziliensis]